MVHVILYSSLFSVFNFYYLLLFVPYVCLFFLGGGGFCPPPEFFTHLETSPVPVKGFNYNLCSALMAIEQ